MKKVNIFFMFVIVEIFDLVFLVLLVKEVIKRFFILDVVFVLIELVWLVLVKRKVKVWSDCL